MAQYIGVFRNEKGGAFVYVGDRTYFPSSRTCEFLERIDLGEMTLQQLSEDALRSPVKFGSLCVHPDATQPPQNWRAINMGSSVHSVDEVVQSAKEYFAPYLPH